MLTLFGFFFVILSTLVLMGRTWCDVFVWDSKEFGVPGSWCPGWASPPLQTDRSTARACCLQLVCNSSLSHWFSQRLKLRFHNHQCHIWAIPDLTENIFSPGRVWTHSPASAESEQECGHQRENNSCSGLIPARRSLSCWQFQIAVD